MLSPVAGENVTVLLIVVVAELLPGCFPINTNEGRNVQAIAISGQLFCKLCTRHFALVSISEGLQILLSVEFNECLNCVGIIILKEFSQDVILLGIITQHFFLLNCGGSDTTRLQNCFVECSESRFAILPNITAGQTLRGTVSGFHFADHVQESGTGESVGHVLLCLVCVNYKGWEGSVAITDVPDSPLSTVGGLGLIPLAEPLAAQFTLTLLLLHHLKRNGGEFRIAGVDAVGIELDFVHVRKIGWIQTKVNRLGTVPRPSHAVEEIRHCFLILLISREAISEPSGNLAVALGCGREVTTLSEDLLSVGVLCFVHALTIAQIHGFGSSR